MNWGAFSLRGGLGDWVTPWDLLNRALYSAHPLFDSRFMSALLRYFGAGDEMLLVHATASLIDGMLILAPHRRGVYRTFVPAQAQITPVLATSPTVLRNLFTALRPTVVAVDLMCQDLRYIPDGGAEWPKRTMRLRHAMTMSIDLQGDFGHYWGSRPKNLRKNIHRYEHRLERADRSVRLVVTENPGEMPAAVRRYGELECRGWKGRAGTAVDPDGAQGRFYVDVLTSFAATGAASVYEYYIGDRLAASRLVIGNDEMAVILKTTYDEELREFAPGRLLLYRVLEREFEQHRRRRVEFYTNATRDQLEWATDTREIAHVTLYRNDLVRVAHGVARRVKAALKHGSA